MIDLSQVKSKCRRDDADQNNRVHWFASKFSIYFSWIFINLGLSADFVTAVFFGVGVLGVCAWLVGGFWGIVLCYGCWRLHIIIDMSDGDVARYNGTYSHRGKYWDSMIHSVLNPLYSAVFPLAAFLTTRDIEFLVLLSLLMFSQSILLASKYNFPQNALNKAKPNRYNGKPSLPARLIKIASEVIGMEGFIVASITSSSIADPLSQKIVFIAFASANFCVAAIKFYQLSYYQRTYSKLH